jgi:hypothetical protein
VRRIIELKREEVAGGWKRLHNEELHNFYASQTITVYSSGGCDGRDMEHAWVRLEMNAKVWSRNLKVNISFRRCMPRWEDNIRMDLRKIEWGGMDWINLDQDRDQWRSPVNMVMKLQVS